jgi:ABC-type transport system substrate-binding protein
LISSRNFLVASAAIAASSPSGTNAAGNQVLRIGMTAADSPTVTGLPNDGGEGARFLRYPVYDAVVNWEPFADRRVRQAMNHAIDREGMCRS